MKITDKVSASSKEGFGPFDDPNSIDQTQREFKTLVAEYGAASQALIDKRKEYFKQASGKEGFTNNTNVFINRTAGIDKITATADPGKCSTNAILSGSGIEDAGNPFYNAYPSNFSNIADAENACKLWAADSGATHFALSKSADNKQFKCSTGNFSGTPTQYSAAQVGYVLASNMDATMGGLYKDGTIGIFNSEANSSGADTKNITLASLNAGGSVPQGYSVCDKWFGGGINTSSINASLGRNCSGLSKPPFSARYITIVNTPGTCIQISQVAVYVYDDSTGAISNVAPSGTVTNMWPGNPSLNWYGYQSHIGWTNNGTTSTRDYPYLYHSIRSDKADLWQLDLQKDYPIFKVVYYNRKDCCRSRTKGQTLLVEDGAQTKKITKTLTGSAVQAFSIADSDAVDSSEPKTMTTAKLPTFTTPHLDQAGSSLKIWDSANYAANKGGRLGTAAELLNYINQRGGGSLTGGRDSWVAVLNGFQGQYDYIQIGDARLRQSHLQYYGFPGWSNDSGGGNGFTDYVFWMGS